MSPTKTFFAEKQAWSEIKDDVLQAYLVPYLAKVASMGKPIRIADSFAGKGRFDDGAPGSPLIICEAVKEQILHPGNKTSDIQAIFVEKKYSKELAENLSVYPYAKVLEGEYEERVAFLVDQYDPHCKSLFIYVDPFGIKSLLFSYFQKLCQKPFHTIELLLNLNAFGFLREGCRLLGLEMNDEEEQPIPYKKDVNSPERLDEIAGGNYWRELVSDYYNQKIQMKEAEEEFVRLYCGRMNTVFKHVLNIPIKAKLNHIPKYRIVFGTNHDDGLLLMADNMSKRWDRFREDQRKGQRILFEMDFPESSQLYDCLRMDDDLLHEIGDNEVELKQLLICFVRRYGISFPIAKYRDILKDLEKRQAIAVRREPAYTENGKKRSGWAHDSKDYRIFIKRAAKPWQQNLL